MRLVTSFCILFLLSMFAACHDQRSDPASLVAETEARCIPDRRTAVFDYVLKADRHEVILQGVTTDAALIDSVRSILELNHYKFINRMNILPDTASLNGKPYGVVNLSVCNFRSNNDFTAELWLQGLLGQPVHLLQHGNWYRVQTPDDYISWVHPAGITPMTEAEFRQWMRSEKVIVTAHYAFACEQPDPQSQHVSDLVAGDRLMFLSEQRGYFEVQYPDGRRAYIEKSVAERETQWRKELQQDAGSIIRTAFTLMGVPYMWGANSSKAVDCSGFIRTILFLHDILIPRDASQMARVGERIEIEAKCANLIPGDLIFFGQRGEKGAKDRVAHVAMYIGDRRFIHSQGDVHVSSFDPQDPLYDAFNLNRRLYGGRVLPYLNRQKEINTTLTNPYYLLPQ